MSKPSYVVYPAKIANQLVRKYQKEFELICDPNELLQILDKVNYE